MDSEEQEMCRKASINARALEEMMLTCSDVAGLTEDDADDVIERCEQIISCMRKIHGD